MVPLNLKEKLLNVNLTKEGYVTIKIYGFPSKWCTRNASNIAILDDEIYGQSLVNSLRRPVTFSRLCNKTSAISLVR